MPRKVEELVRRISKQNPTYSEAQAWATAWSVYCRNINPGSRHCRRPPSEYFAGDDQYVRVPAAVQVAVRDGLELRERVSPSAKCCTAAGLMTARLLASGRFPVSRLRKMRSYFARHAVDNRGSWPDDSRGYQAWLLWGGDPGRRWVERLLRG